MEAVIFCGIQALGQTTLYHERFAGTHVRVSLDELKSRARERALVQSCLGTKQHVCAAGAKAAFARNP